MFNWIDQVVSTILINTLTEYVVIIRSQRGQGYLVWGSGSFFTILHLQEMHQNSTDISKVTLSIDSNCYNELLSFLVDVCGSGGFAEMIAKCLYPICIFIMICSIEECRHT